MSSLDLKRIEHVIRQAIRPELLARVPIGALGAKIHAALIGPKQGWLGFKEGIITKDELVSLLLAHVDTLLSGQVDRSTLGHAINWDELAERISTCIPADPE